MPEEPASPARSRCRGPPGSGPKPLCAVLVRFYLAHVPSSTQQPLRLRACVVDDHDLVRDWITARLESLGIEVCASATTVAGGVAAILDHQPDVAVVDDRLPDGRGIDLCRQVAAVAPAMTLILHVGSISPEEQTEALAAGVARVALKSIQGDDLTAAIAEVLDRRIRPVVVVVSEGGLEPPRPNTGTSTSS